MKKIDGILYAMFSSAAFGFMPIFAKTELNNGVSTITVVILRFLVASAILFIYFVFAKIDYKLNKKQIMAIALIAITGYSTTALLLFMSYNYISVGVATTMHFVYPAVVTILSFIVYKEKLYVNKIISLLLSTAGVYILVGFDKSGMNFKGAALAIFSGFTYAGCIIGMAHEDMKKIDSRVMTFYMALFSGITMLIFGAINKSIVFHFNMNTVSSAIGISLISTVIAIVAFVRGVKIIGPSSAAILSTFEPIVSMIMGILIFSEKLTFTIIIGSILIILSVIILSVSGNKQESSDVVA